MGGLGGKGEWTLGARAGPGKGEEGSERVEEGEEGGAVWCGET
jgi:hypothetical protein